MGVLHGAFFLVLLLSALPILLFPDLPAAGVLAFDLTAAAGRPLFRKLCVAVVSTWGSGSSGSDDDSLSVRVRFDVSDVRLVDLLRLRSVVQV